MLALIGYILFTLIGALAFITVVGICAENKVIAIVIAIGILYFILYFGVTGIIKQINLLG